MQEDIPLSMHSRARIRAQAAGLNIGRPISGPVSRTIVERKKQSELKRVETSRARATTCRASIFDFAHLERQTRIESIELWPANHDDSSKVSDRTRSALVCVTR